MKNYLLTTQDLSALDALPIHEKAKDKVASVFNNHDGAALWELCRNKDNKQIRSFVLRFVNDRFAPKLQREWKKFCLEYFN